MEVSLTRLTGIETSNDVLLANKNVFGESKLHTYGNNRGTYSVKVLGNNFKLWLI